MNDKGFSKEETLGVAATVFHREIIYLHFIIYFSPWPEKLEGTIRLILTEHMRRVHAGLVSATQNRANFSNYCQYFAMNPKAPW